MTPRSFYRAAGTALVLILLARAACAAGGIRTASRGWDPNVAPHKSIELIGGVAARQARPGINQHKRGSGRAIE